MKNKHTYHAVARGFSLVELMVSMAIGLIMLLAVSYFLIGSQRSGRAHDDSSRMQENGRNALDTLGRAIRQAGYYSSSPIVGALTGTDGAAADSITVRYDAQPGGERDCTGTNVAGGTLVFVFSVNASRQLTCSNGGASVVVADNVEDMEITYGVDPEKDGSVASYRSAGAVTDFTKVAVVKVVLTMRGTNASGEAGGDGYLRQTYGASYTVRNQAG